MAAADGRDGKNRNHNRARCTGSMEVERRKESTEVADKRVRVSATKKAERKELRKEKGKNGRADKGQKGTVAPRNAQLESPRRNGTEETGSGGGDPPLIPRTYGSRGLRQSWIATAVRFCK